MSNDTTQQAPYITIYEWDTPHGIHRSFSPVNWNGWEPTRAVKLVEATQPTQDDPKAEVLALREREHRLGLMLMKMREAWWPFVHSAGLLASNHARGLLKESTEVLSEDATPVIDMVLFCPNCGKQHIDAPETIHVGSYRDGVRNMESSAVWTNPPHRSHLCHHCGCIWRPADVPTNGVAAIETKGKADTWVGKASFAAPAEATQPTQAEAPSERERRELQEVANRLREVGYHNAANNTERNISDIKSGIIPRAVIGAALATQQAGQPTQAEAPSEGDAPECARWNFEATDEAVTVCKNFHEKGHACEYEPLHPSELLAIINDLRSRVLEQQARAALATQQADPRGMHLIKESERNWQEIAMERGREIERLRAQQAMPSVTAAVDAFGIAAKDYGVAMQATPGDTAQQRAAYIEARRILLGATQQAGQVEPADVCTDPDNCQRCKAPAWDKHNHRHAGISSAPGQAERDREDEPTAEELEAFRRKHWMHWNSTENLLIAHLVAKLRCAVRSSDEKKI